MKFSIWLEGRRKSTTISFDWQESPEWMSDSNYVAKISLETSRNIAKAFSKKLSMHTMLVNYPLLQALGLVGGNYWIEVGEDEDFRKSYYLCTDSARMPPSSVDFAVLAQFATKEAPDIDWRPTETTPEDHYAV